MKTIKQNENNRETTFAGRCVETCRALLAEIEQAKQMIVNDFDETLDTHGNLFRLALNEAEALATQTAYPHLVYPALAMERVQAVADWRTRQAALNQRHPMMTA